MDKLFVSIHHLLVELFLIASAAIVLWKAIRDELNRK